MATAFTDFRTPNLAADLETSIAPANDEYWIVSVKYNKKHLTTQSPWLRSTSGWTVQDSQYGKNYNISFSTLPPQEQSESNSKMVEDFKGFNEEVNQAILNIVKENWDTFMPGQECPNDEVLKESLTSVIRPEQPPYPERYQYRLNDMVENDKFIGGVFEQTYNPDTQKVESGIKSGVHIENIRKHARVRLQIVLKGFYISVKDTEVLGETIKQIRFGANWMVQKLLFYNVLGALTEEETLKSFTFGDINVAEGYNPDTTTGAVKVNVVEKRKTSGIAQEDDDGVLDGAKTMQSEKKIKV